MKVLLDCGAGIAGDMLLGAMIDLGLSLRDLESTLKRALHVKDWSIESRKVERQYWPARTFQVKGDRPFGSATRMKQTIQRSKLPLEVRRKSIAVIQALEMAERHAHGHAHPAFDDEGLGLLDTLIDVVGTSWGFWKLGVTEIQSTPVHIGRLAPAAAWLVAHHRIPVYRYEGLHELATPTGIAILTQSTPKFSAGNASRLQRTGYGAGSRDTPGRPNVLGMSVVDSNAQLNPFTQDHVIRLDTLIDDMDPRLYPYISDLLFEAGALDAWWMSAGMKKGRPGTSFSVLCKPGDEAKMVEILFRESTTLGIRRQGLDRWVLSRNRSQKSKTALLPNGERKSQKEFEPMKAEARRTATPLRKLLK